MKSEFKGELVPEESEGIEQAMWKNKREVKEALQNSYANIKLLFPDEYFVVESEIL